VAEAEAPAAASTVEEEALDALDLPHAADLLRLLPGVSISVSGPRGTQTQLRLRGAEANHILLFVDGIRLNDPAAGNEARFELLGTDLLSRIELVPGPQSALWGPEALGGVVSVETADPFAREGGAALGEYGSLDSVRASAQGAARSGNFGLSAGGSWLAAGGIDSFGATGGERDGFEMLSLGLRAAWRPAGGTELGITGLYLAGTSEYDGFDPVTFRRADTRDETDNRIAAVRGWGSLERGGWTLSADASLLDSANRNRLGEAALNRTAGRRATAGAQLSRESGGHRLTAAVAHEREDFRARDQLFFGATDQDRSRSLTGLIAEWSAGWSEALTTNLAVRHDSFSAFDDAATVRAAVLVRPSDEWTLLAAYGEGIAQPTFYDLFGFFPGSFRGNPELRPERSRGWEAGATWRRARALLRATAFTSALKSEIVDVFDPATFLSSTRNVEGASRRRGIEVSGQYRLGEAAQVHASYTFLDADERREPADAAIREPRRPRHSASLAAFGSAGRLSWSGTLAYVGARRDTDFDLFPPRPVRLGDYVLGSIRLGWRLTDSIEAYGRAENALGADYQDVVGYHTPARTVHAGLRLRLGR
ncbi:MAG: TonB-dependent receptor, partial [Pseudomonadota bacterium]|nr:TonB-dependent receptor [Pseudomonadota bacterium]